MHSGGWPASSVSSSSSSSSRAPALCRAARVACSRASRSNAPTLRRALTITLSRLPTSAWTAAWIARSVFFGPLGRLLQVLRRGGPQLADALVDVDELGGELLEATERGHLAFGLAHLGRRGERQRHGLAADLVGQSRHGAVAGMARLGAGAVGLAATAEEGLDGTAAEVTDLGEFEQEPGAVVFQGSEGIGHGPSLVCIYLLYTDRRGSPSRLPSFSQKCRAPDVSRAIF